MLEAFHQHKSSQVGKTRHPGVIVNQWLQLGELEWVTRYPGFSLLKKRVEFGPFLTVHPDGAQGTGWMIDSDRAFGFKSDGIRNLSLMDDPGNEAELHFCFKFESGAEIQVTKTHALDKESPRAVQRIKNCLGIDGHLPPEPWLDEWVDCRESECADCPFSCSEVSDQISKWTSLDLQLETPDLEINTTLNPHWIDRDRTVLRVDDHTHHTFLYIDLSSPAVRITNRDGRSGLISIRPVSDN